MLNPKQNLDVLSQTPETSVIRFGWTTIGKNVLVWRLVRKCVSGNRLEAHYERVEANRPETEGGSERNRLGHWQKTERCGAHVEATRSLLRSATLRRRARRTAPNVCRTVANGVLFSVQSEGFAGRRQKLDATRIMRERDCEQEMRGLAEGEWGGGRWLFYPPIQRKLGYYYSYVCEPPTCALLKLSSPAPEVAGLKPMSNG